MSQLTEYADAELMAMGLANRLAGDLRAALAQEDRVLFVVPGGSTPGPVFDGLCDVELDWARVDVLLSDERWVPEDHARSNTRLIRERLLRDKAGAARFLPLYEAAETPEEVLERIEAGIVPHLPIGVCLLGMGEDMHTASLFPGADRLEEALSRDAAVLLTMRAPGVEEPRITLSARVLDDAMAKHVVITGEAKRAAYERAQGLSDTDAPIRTVLDAATVHWAPEE